MAEHPPPHPPLIVDTGFDDQRIDNYLFSIWKKIPKSLVYRLLRQGNIRLNGRRAKPESRVRSGDEIRYPRSLVHSGEQKKLFPAKPSQPLKLHILYEDDRLLAINKPAGCSVHAGSGVLYGLVETLRTQRQCPQLELVHRLDKPTSGCLLLAKRLSAHRILQQAWKDSRVEKRYVLLVHGVWPSHLKHINAPLSAFRYEGGERLIKVDPKEGKSASTRFKILKRFEKHTLLEAILETGRTHQIRVHARHAGFPIVGDQRYGDRESDKRLGVSPLRLFLHAQMLSFPHPVEARVIKLEAPLDASWNAIEQVLGKKR